MVIALDAEAVNGQQGEEFSIVGDGEVRSNWLAGSADVTDEWSTEVQLHNVQASTFALRAGAPRHFGGVALSVGDESILSPRLSRDYRGGTLGQHAQGKTANSLQAKHITVTYNCLKPGTSKLLLTVPFGGGGTAHTHQKLPDGVEDAAAKAVAEALQQQIAAQLHTDSSNPFAANPHSAESLSEVLKKIELPSATDADADDDEDGGDAVDDVDGAADGGDYDSPIQADDGVAAQDEDDGADDAEVDEGDDAEDKLALAELEALRGRSDAEASNIAMISYGKKGVADEQGETPPSPSSDASPKPTTATSAELAQSDPANSPVASDDGDSCIPCHRMHYMVIFS